MKTRTKRFKQSMAAGVALTTLGLSLAGVGMASAAANTANNQTSLIDKIASKFNLNKADVAAVFTADQQEHLATMQADQAARLAQAVTDGKLTQAQADYITNAQKEIETLMSGTDPSQQTDTQRAAVKAKLDALRTWATTNNVDEQYVRGAGGHGGGMPPADAPASSSAATTN